MRTEEILKRQKENRKSSDGESGLYGKIPNFREISQRVCATCGYGYWGENNGFGRKYVCELGGLRMNSDDDEEWRHVCDSWTSDGYYTSGS